MSPRALAARAFGRTPGRLWATLRTTLLLAAGLSITWAISDHMTRAVEDGGRKTALNQALSLSHLLASDWSETFARLEYLHHLGQRITDSMKDGVPDAHLLAELREAARAQGAGVEQVVGVNERGDVIWSTHPERQGPVNIATSEVFLTLANGHRGHYICPPRAGDTFLPGAILVATANRAPDDALRGMTVISLNENLSTRLARTLGISDTGVVTIIRGDNTIIARSDGKMIGQRAAVPPSLHDKIRRDDVTAFLSVSPIDGVRRFSAVVGLAEIGMVVSVGLDEAPQMASYRAAEARIQDAAALVGLSLLAVASLSSTGYRYYEAARRERRAREESERRGALLREVGDRASDLISLQDSDFRNLFANPSCVSVLGVGLEQLLSARFGDLAIDADRAIVDTAFARLRAGSPRERFIFRVRKPGGVLVWLEAEMVGLSDGPPGAPGMVRYVTICRDVSDREIHEERLRASQAEILALATLGPGVFYRAVEQEPGRFHVIFPAGNSLLGHPEDALTDPGFIRAHMSPADWEMKAQALRTCLETGASAVEYRFPNPAGDPRWVRDHMRRIEDPNGRAVLIGYLTDITTEREGQAHMRQIERLATLGEVSTGIAHEMNQPLTAISMAAENALRLLRRGGDLAGLEEKLTRINAQAARLSKIVELTGLFGRVDRATRTRADMRDVIANVEILVADRLRSANARLVVELPPGLPDIAGIPVLLEQVLMNLIVNSCDAYGEVPVRAEAPPRLITVTAAAEDKSISVTVADQAGGIPESVLARVFDPFFTTKPPGKGTGLGLSISFASIADMGGTLTARDADGGAVFEITLPAATDDMPRVRAA